MTSTPSADLHFRSYGQVRASDRHDFAQLVLPLSGTLLLDTLALDTPRPASRLAALMARVEADPGQPWTTEAMAVATGLSVSRLHALFREERDTSPHAWLLDLRLARVRTWLAQTGLPIAELALRAGFSEQSALTRAMRRATGQTPAQYRRAVRRAAAEKTSN